MLNIKEITLDEDIDNSKIIEFEEAKKNAENETNTETEHEEIYPSFEYNNPAYAYYKSYFDIDVTISNDNTSIDLTKRIMLCSFHKESIISDSIFNNSGVFSKYDPELKTEFFGEHELGGKNFASGIVPYAIANWYNENLKMKWNIVPKIAIKGDGIEHVYNRDDLDPKEIDVERTLENIVCVGFRIYFETKGEWTKYKLISH